MESDLFFPITKIDLQNPPFSQLLPLVIFVTCSRMHYEVDVPSSKSLGAADVPTSWDMQ